MADLTHSDLKKDLDIIREQQAWFRDAVERIEAKLDVVGRHDERIKSNTESIRSLWRVGGSAAGILLTALLGLLTIFLVGG